MPRFSIVSNSSLLSHLGASRPCAHWSFFSHRSGAPGTPCTIFGNPSLRCLRIRPGWSLRESKQRAAALRRRLFSHSSTSLLGVRQTTVGNPYSLTLHFKHVEGMGSQSAIVVTLITPRPFLCRFRMRTSRPWSVLSGKDDFSQRFYKFNELLRFKSNHWFNKTVGDFLQPEN